MIHRYIAQWANPNLTWEIPPGFVFVYLLASWRDLRSSTYVHFPSRLRRRNRSEWKDAQKVVRGRRHD